MSCLLEAPRCRFLEAAEHLAAHYAGHAQFDIAPVDSLRFENKTPVRPASRRRAALGMVNAFSTTRTDLGIHVGAGQRSRSGCR
jgi:hypothetical protein